jgi:pimeloyl-ACP methyl ester carboxylesterase
LVETDAIMRGTWAPGLRCRFAAVTTRRVAVGQGRAMMLDDVGDPAGVPLLYLHGTPDSRLARPEDDGPAARARVRLLALDRPGYGGSDPLPIGGSSWTGRLARDVGVVLDELQVERVALLAWSGGTLAALALAASLPAQVSALGIVAGLVPRRAYDDPAVRRAGAERLRMLELADTLPPGQLGRRGPLLAPYPCDHALALEHQAEHRDPAGARELASVAGGTDRMADALVEAVRHGLAGVAADVEAQARALDVDVTRRLPDSSLVRVRRRRHAAGVRRVVRPGAPRRGPARRSRRHALPAVHAVGGHPGHTGGGRDPLTPLLAALRHPRRHPAGADVHRLVPLP